MVLDLTRILDRVGTEVWGILGFMALRPSAFWTLRDALVDMRYHGPEWLVNYSGK